MSRRPGRGSAPALAALAVAALGLGSCGGGEEPREAVDVERARIASSLSSLACRDWERADDATRADIVVELQSFAASQVTGRGISGTGPVLAGEQAIELFENRCGPRYARGFVLYKLYFHAAALAGRS